LPFSSKFQSALEVYCKTSKQIPSDNSYALIRKARRLDALLKENNKPAPNQSPEIEPECHKCKTQYSPFFWPDESEGGVICHRCKTTGEMASDSERKPSVESEGHPNGNENDEEVEEEEEEEEVEEVDVEPKSQGQGVQPMEVDEWVKPPGSKATEPKAKVVAASG
jgi:hypothetical protein